MSWRLWIILSALVLSVVLPAEASAQTPAISVTKDDIAALAPGDSYVIDLSSQKESYQVDLSSGMDLSRIKLITRTGESVRFDEWLARNEQVYKQAMGAGHIILSGSPEAAYQLKGDLDRNYPACTIIIIDTPDVLIIIIVDCA